MFSWVVPMDHPQKAWEPHATSTHRGHPGRDGHEGPGAEEERACLERGRCKVRVLCSLWLSMGEGGLRWGVSFTLRAESLPASPLEFVKAPRPAIITLRKLRH